MTDESTLILLRCKLRSLKICLQKARDTGSPKKDLIKWETACLKTQQEIVDLEI